MMNTNRPRALPTITDLATQLDPRTVAAWHALERDIHERTRKSPMLTCHHCGLDIPRDDECIAGDTPFHHKCFDAYLALHPLPLYGDPPSEATPQEALQPCKHRVNALDAGDVHCIDCGAEVR